MSGAASKPVSSTEIAHYFWRDNTGWVDEGVANTVEYMHGLENGLSRGQLKPAP